MQSPESTKFIPLRLPCSSFLRYKDLPAQYRGFLLASQNQDHRLQGLVGTLLTWWPHEFLKGIDCSGEAPRFQFSNKINPWLRRMFSAFVNDKYAVRRGDTVARFISLTGVGSASKTFSSGLFAVCWWGVSPKDSIVVLTSTTKDMIRSRSWNVIRHFVTTARELGTGEEVPFGRLIDSQMKLYPEGELSSAAPAGIFAYAVAHGETLKAIDNLKGLHARRMLVIIDEANGTPEAIFNVLPNYRKACKDLTVIVIGNPALRLDPHGRSCKPAKGWALAEDDTNIEWATEGVTEWQLDPGVCLRFDGRDSPNVKAGTDKYPYIFGCADWEAAKSHEGTFAWYTQSRGLWPAEGLASTVFNEMLFVRCACDKGQEFVFDGRRETVVSLDPAFGGDACQLSIGWFGESNGRKSLQLVESFEVEITPGLNTDIDYQVARRVISELIVRKVEPSNFIMDSTGIGRGVAAIIAAEWSPLFHSLSFAGSATERLVNNGGAQMQPAKDLYVNFVTEMHYALRDAIESGQVKGFSREAINELCCRQTALKGKRWQIEPKSEMKARLRFSPDIADTMIMLWELARRNGAEVQGKLEQTAEASWKQQVRAAQQDYATADVHGESGWAEDAEEPAAPSVVYSGGWD